MRRSRLHRRKMGLRPGTWRVTLWTIAILLGCLNLLIAGQLSTPQVHAQELSIKRPPMAKIINPTIQSEIKDVFGKDYDKAMSLLTGTKDCRGENGSLNPLAENHNSDVIHSIDYGIFQINDHWQGVSNVAFLKDPSINIRMAYNIYHRDGDSFKLWTGGRCQGI